MIIKDAHAGGSPAQRKEPGLHVQEWLENVPAVSVYALVGLVIGLESLGIPLPGEIVLVSAALLSSQHGDVDPVILGACATAGAVIGDSIGYAIGRKGGRPLLAWLERKFPKHFSAANVGSAERSFQKWGMWAVFFGRFVALLRIFAGPLAGVLRMPYWKFAIANVLGGIVWAGGTTAVIYYIGVVAEDWLKRFSYVGLGIAVLIGIGSMLLVKRRAKRAAEEYAARTAAGADAPDADAPDAGACPGAGASGAAPGSEPGAAAEAEAEPAGTRAPAVG